VASTQRPAPPDAPSDPGEDVVGDRARLITFGMVAVFVACVVFGALRFQAHLASGLATPWWGNVGGAAAIALLYAWFRRDPYPRSTVGVHGTALIATIALLVPDEPPGSASTM
jgi:hypothetical protein